ncbi:hypothetical protein ACQPW1_36250 [Nocardia sp. CA-128927]|uniref:hypothetical protein n=1 Tax=Nocardia sp. CA-128927 TaxID=3239975 RepID=UPI003D966AB4
MSDLRESHSDTVDFGHEKDEALRSLSESFERHQLPDAGTGVSAALLNATGWLHDFARTAGQTLTTVEDNAFTHRPIELSPTQLTDTREAIATAAIRSQPGTRNRGSVKTR